MLIGIGIAFAIAIVALVSTQSPRPISDEELQRKTGELPEVKVFLSKYPDANIQFNQDVNIRTIDYATSLRNNEGSSGFLYLLKLNIVVDEISGETQEIVFTCTKTEGSNSTSYSVSDHIEEEIRAENCMRQ